MEDETRRENQVRGGLKGKRGCDTVSLDNILIIWMKMT
jgi:hypothetical protein